MATSPMPMALEDLGAQVAFELTLYIVTEFQQIIKAFLGVGAIGEVQLSQVSEDGSSFGTHVEPCGLCPDCVCVCGVGGGGRGS